MMHPSRKRCSGFTLIELILATTMTAMLALTLYTTMSVAFRTRGTIERQISSAREASVVLDLVQQDLQSVLKPSGILAGAFVGYAMGTTGAETDSLSFHALGGDRDVDSPLADGMRKIELALHSDANGSVLLRRVERNLLAPSAKEPEEEILSRRVAAFSVRYFDGTSWYSEWDSTLHENTLPVALDLRLTMNITDSRGETTQYRATRIVPLACGETTATAIGGG